MPTFSTRSRRAHPRLVPAPDRYIILKNLFLMPSKCCRVRRRRRYSPVRLRTYTIIDFDIQGKKIYIHVENVFISLKYLFNLRRPKGIRPGRFVLAIRVAKIALRTNPRENVRLKLFTSILENVSDKYSAKALCCCVT